jgi:hypothetical protein
LSSRAFFSLPCHPERLPPTLVIPSAVEGSLDKGNALKGSVHFLRSFLLTSEEKEPKKNATPKPLQRGFSLFRGKTLYIKVLVWLAKPVPYGRAMVSATTRGWSPFGLRQQRALALGVSQYLIPENTRGAARAKGQTAPTSEGGGSEHKRAGEDNER